MQGLAMYDIAPGLGSNLLFKIQMWSQEFRGDGRESFK